MRVTFAILFATVLCLGSVMAADAVPSTIVLPSTFSDHMVLQRDIPVPIRGVAKPGSRLTIQFAGQRVKAKADETGNWETKLAPMRAGGPFDLTIKSRGATAVVKDVLVGDVWGCSGQSNMEWPIDRSRDPLPTI
ncbi:MAG TPA: sialate O-acetylesterase, partial [Candidatus Hydrogenedentes bacterium]|nr:sialate O-acetylesterase [Candidatus Hydrogenedentota bacterium]